MGLGSSASGVGSVGGGGSYPNSQPLYNSNLLADVLLRTNLAVLLLDSFLSSLLVIMSSASVSSSADSRS